jgi:tellurite resistance protein
MPSISLPDCLRQLGVDRDRVELVALLPLVRVAWADGYVQQAERELIIEIASRHDLFGPGDREVVEGWLGDQPSDFFLDTTERVLRELAQLAVFPGARDIVDQCWALAEAAGGLLGTSLFAVGAEERAAIEEMAAALGVSAERGPAPPPPQP